jgi:kynurenine formamidase
MNNSGISDVFLGSELIDLSHIIDEERPGAHRRYERITWMTPSMSDRFNAGMIFIFEHAGTHVDAPIHLAGVEGPTIEKILLQRWCGECCVIDVKGKERNGLVEVEEITAWENSHRKIEKDDCVLFDFDWPSPWDSSDEGNRIDYSGNPGISEKAAEYLVLKRVKLVGTDVPNVDASSDKTSKAHRVLLDNQVSVLETLTNLHKLPPTGAFLMAFPLKIKNGSGSPVRAAAFIPRK